MASDSPVKTDEFSAEEQRGLYRAIFSRRDIRPGLIRAVVRPSKGTGFSAPLNAASAARTKAPSPVLSKPSFVGN